VSGCAKISEVKRGVPAIPCDEAPGTNPRTHEAGSGAAGEAEGIAGGRANAADPSTATRAWGLMPRTDYRRAVEDCIKCDLQPRFKRLRIETQPWSPHAI
jgi:hypothetical protein